MILVILIFLILICFVKISNNQEIIKNNCHTEEDKANVKNAKKVFGKARYSIIMLILSFILLIAIIICQFTKIDTMIINYFSADFYVDDFFNVNYYYIPAFLIVCRKIIVEVKISEFLHKYFKIVEEEISSKEVIHSILYKKKKVEVKEETKEENKASENISNTTPTPQSQETETNPTNETNPEETKPEEPKVEQEQK